MNTNITLPMLQEEFEELLEDVTAVTTNVGTLLQGTQTAVFSNVNPTLVKIYTFEEWIDRYGYKRASNKVVSRSGSV